MNKLGRFALFSIGCIIELIILDLCSFPFSSLTWIQHVLCTFAYPLIMIMLFRIAQKAGKKKKKSLLAFASYILSAALIIDIVESLIYMYIANSGEEGYLNEMYSIHAYLYNFTVYFVKGSCA